MTDNPSVSWNDAPLVSSCACDGTMHPVCAPEPEPPIASMVRAYKRSTAATGKEPPLPSANDGQS